MNAFQSFKYFKCFNKGPIDVLLSSIGVKLTYLSLSCVTSINFRKC